MDLPNRIFLGNVLNQNVIQKWKPKILLVSEYSKNWVKERVSESGNSKQIELSNSNPDSFIHYTSESRFQRDDFRIVKIIKK